MTIKTPDEVTAAISKLECADQVAVQAYIAKLKAAIADLEVQHRMDVHEFSHSEEKDLGLSDKDEWTGTGFADNGDEHAQDESTPPEPASKLPPPPPLYTPSITEDFDKAGAAKSEASQLKSEGKYDEALEKYTEAITVAPPSALLYANRADVLYRLKRYQHAVRDCDEAIKLNPDSAKALRIRGRSKKQLGEWEQARQDLSASQAIDFDDVAADDLKFVQEKVKDIEQKKVQERLKVEQRNRKKAEEIRKAQEEEKKAREKSAARGASAPPFGMGGGGMGGMAGMAGLMQTLMSDPELAAGLKNPKIMAAFADLMKSPGGAMGLMSNPAKLQELMADPEIGPFMKKIVTKLGPMMMGGGMPGMPANMNSNNANGNNDDMPDIPDVGNDMPNLD